MYICTYSKDAMLEVKKTAIGKYKKRNEEQTQGVCAQNSMADDPDSDKHFSGLKALTTGDLRSVPGSEPHA